MIRALTDAADPAGKYVHWGVVQISVTNIAIIGFMLLLFILALVVPFPSGADSQGGPDGGK